VSFQYRNAESVRAAVRAAQEEHVDQDGEVIDEHNTEVRKANQMNSISISYAKSYTIFYIIANEIAKSYTISYTVLCMEIRYFTDFPLQVEKLVRSLKHNNPACSCIF
jgi:hypothetical protein